jgi:predicted nucleotidyltransferase
MLNWMPSRLSDTLAGAALSETERRVVERIVAALQQRLGESLLAVWLYGSRARGEADPTEMDDDRRSDVDMIAIVDPSTGWSTAGGQAVPLIFTAAEAEGDSPAYYSVHVYDAEQLRDRRRIRSFFFQEVDRDKLVLAGGDLEGGEYG